MNQTRSTILDQLVRAGAHLTRQQSFRQLISVLVEQAMDISRSDLAALYIKKEPDNPRSPLKLTYKRGKFHIPFLPVVLVVNILSGRVNMTDFIYPELSSKVLKCSFTVHSELGPGFVEKTYGNAMAVELRLSGIPFEREVFFPVFYKGERVGEYYADFVVDGSIILEFKFVKCLLPLMDTQTVSYLKASGIKVGYLMNFNTRSLEWKRFFRRCLAACSFYPLIYFQIIIYLIKRVACFLTGSSSFNHISFLEKFFIYNTFSIKKRSIRYLS